MKKLASLLLLGIAACTVRAQESKEPYQVKSLSNDAIQQVKCETSGGHIKVAGVDGNARIEIYIQGNNSNDKLSKEEIKKRLEENYDFSITSENHTLTATAKAKKGFNDWKHSLSISFEVYVPHNVSTNLSTSGGHISLSSLSGKQDFSTSGGHLALDHLSGTIKGRTSGGHISLTDLKDNIDLSTSGGHIEAKNSSGEIKLSTSGGHLELSNLSGNINAGTSGGNVRAADIDGSLTAHTSGGGIDMKNLSCTLEASTSGGSVNVEMKSLGKFVKVSTSGGHINLQIPQNKGVDLSLHADKVDAEGLVGFKGDVKKDRVEGSMNGGGIPVTAHGGNRITLTMK